jgi:ribosomal subunit interface protein
MQIPLQITFKGMEPTEAIEAKIRQKVDKLNKHHDRITACHVLVEAPHRSHNKGVLFTVHIDLTVPGGEIAVNKEHGDEHAHEDLYVAIRDAFAAAERQLEHLITRRRDSQRRPG